MTAARTLSNLAYLFAGMALAYGDIYDGPPAMNPVTMTLGLAIGCACLSVAIRRIR